MSIAKSIKKFLGISEESYSKAVTTPVVIEELAPKKPAAKKTVKKAPTKKAPVKKSTAKKTVKKAPKKGK